MVFSVGIGYCYSFLHRSYCYHHLGFLLHSIFCVAKKVLATLLQLVIPMLLCGTTMYLLGGFSSQTSPINSANCIGLGYRSANLNMLWNPIAANNALVIKTSKVYNQFQDEGVCYLGLGGLVGLIMGMIGLCINKKLGKSISMSRSFMTITFMMCVVCGVLALSPRVTFGDKVLIDYSSMLPKPIIGFWEVFRSSGRFVWPVYYLALLFIASQQRSLFDNRRNAATLSVVVLLGLQLVDLFPGMRINAKDRIEVSFHSSILANVKTDLKEKDIMLFDRPLCCMEDLNEYSEFLYIAINNKMKINTFYLARYDEELMVNQFPSIWVALTDSMQMDNAIIVVSKDYSTYAIPSLQSHDGGF